MSTVVFSVIIPTYNRASVLRTTLEALARQSPLDPPAEVAERAAQDLTLKSHEVIVVDDGSTDETADVVREMSRTYPVTLRYLSQPNRKQGAARNLGARKARGLILLFLGDDTVPVDEFLRQHFQTHRAGDERLVVIGYTPWARHFRKTRFMEYIGEQGWQFGFSLIEDPEDVPFHFFYTSNLSIHRQFFLSSGGFDEGFRQYGWEDVELGLRLKRTGMRLAYNPKAVAHHHHPTSIDSFIKRQIQVGTSAWTFYRKQPEMAEFLQIHSVPHYSIRRRFRMWLLTRLCALTEQLRRPDLSRYYPDLMSYYYNLGILKGRDD